ERGDIDGVELLLATRLGMLEQVGTTDFLDPGIYALAWSRHARGDAAGAIDLNGRLRLLARERGMLRLEALATIELMRMAWQSPPSRLAHLAQCLQDMLARQPEGRLRSTRWLGLRLAAIGVAFQHALSTAAAERLLALDVLVSELAATIQGPHSFNAWLL